MVSNRIRPAACAALAALSGKPGVVEGFGLQSHGSH